MKQLRNGGGWLYFASNLLLRLFGCQFIKLTPRDFLTKYYQLYENDRAVTSTSNVYKNMLSCQFMYVHIVKLWRQLGKLYSPRTHSIPWGHLHQSVSFLSYHFEILCFLQCSTNISRGLCVLYFFAAQASQVLAGYTLLKLSIETSIEFTTGFSNSPISFGRRGLNEILKHGDFM